MSKVRIGNLDSYERELVKSIEAGEWKSDKQSKANMKRFQRYAKAMVQKDQRVNIRLSSVDLAGLQKRALREGIPYQTLMSSVIHKYVNGIFIERPNE